jgi:hypothetical protein
MTPARSLIRSLPAAVLFLLTAAATASATPSAPLEQVKDESGQFIVSSTDLAVASSIADLSADARKKLVPILGLPTPWKNRIFILILPSEPDKTWPLPVTTAALQGGLLNFTITLRVPGPNATEEFLRSLSQVFLYEKIVLNKTQFKTGTTLPALPFWLQEGTLQLLVTLQNRDWDQQINRRGNIPTWLSSGSNKFALTLESRDWDLVVSRAKQTGKAPTLEKILSWQELPNDPIERLWQQAFTYYLVSSLTRSNDTRDSFQSWLASADTQKPPFASITTLLPDEFAWRAQLERATDRSYYVVYTWHQTETQVHKAMYITLLGSDKDKDIDTTIDQIKPYRNHPNFREAVSNKINELTDIELRANFLWRPVVNYYRNALLLLANIKVPPQNKDAQPARATKSFDAPAIPAKADYDDCIAAAKNYEQQLVKRYEEINDYLNWVVVTRSVDEQISALAPYYQVEKNLKDFQPRQKDRVIRDVLIQP